MGFSVKNSIKVAVTKEITEGTYVAPNDADFITALEDGLEITGTKEAIDRNILGLGLTKAQPRTSNRSVSGSIPVEFKAGSTDGDAPEYGVLMEAGLGAVRSGNAIISDTGHTTTVINVADAAIVEFNVGDTIIVEEAGNFHISPITAIDSTLGAANITLLLAGDAAFSDNVTIKPFTTYYTADSDHPTFSITKYVEDNIKTTGQGNRISSISLESFTANATASWNFGFEGLDFATVVDPLTNTPAYDSSLPPIIVNACVYKNGIELPVSELTLSIENTVAFITATCAASGKISSRISERTVTGTMTPYLSCDDVDIQNEFNNDDLYSIFAYAYNPTATDGEYNQAIAIYIPNASTTELTESDLDGVLQHALSFSASGGADGTGTQLFVSYI